MTRLAAFAAAFTAAPALAHEGPHLHPHGTEFPLAALFAAGLGLYLTYKLIKR